MGIIFQSYLSGDRIYCCSSCRAHLTRHEDIISKTFNGRHGRAYLFNNVINVSTGPAEERNLMTGLHRVCDIMCNVCQTVVGWKYEFAHDPCQKYKEGKFIVEKMRMTKYCGW